MRLLTMITSHRKREMKISFDDKGDLALFEKSSLTCPTEPIYHSITLVCLLQAI